MDDNKLLSIENINVHFHTRRGVVKAVRDLSLYINKGETLALVGESGCGKSVTAHTINQLIPMPPGVIESGSVIFRDRDLLQLPEKEIQKLRGTQISMIFQEPMTSLNPVFKIGDQLADVFLAHQKMSKKKAHAKAVELLDLVKIPSPEKRAMDYPHQLSGGMRQRVMIAMALASPEPGLMIADEPTTALDVTIQAQILDLLTDLKDEVDMSILLITHDMGVVAETADRVVVMYAGRKVEEGTVFQIFDNPSHPYTLGLLNSLPSNEKYGDNNRLEAIPGNVPDLLSLGDGCPFANRCSYGDASCDKEFPGITTVEEGHSIWCYKADDVKNQKGSKS
ncbi:MULTISPECIES: ABC transporter ATP-binding protein [unclassified Oceanispirochaeta]|uniref:ABC transporter ATP-binding protein n=1 Tax=unclassified Oceanispirochaeta TaxID=2635722 RepID=UPI000E09A123|nr:MULTISPECIES: ABC transporter ATP-binding protein [unclassified Oceanispirochaeta]MBF9014089.1 ABC transporter ATP-binding protein [Oceanispirochaeta sp. M2]NPD70580.1 ABC transporter ATP-binding protein [Oceanispirochaeta sp. M1]RDG34346.1 ABC transporter ATP-binding protein [Oceanispirochaeta sp. M1]